MKHKPSQISTLRDALTSKMVPVWSVAAVVVVVAVFVAGALAGIGLEREHAKARAEAAVAAPAVRLVGESVRSSWMRAKVTGVRRETGKNPAFKPTEGNVLLVVGIELQNVSQVVLPISPLEQMYVTDSAHVAHIMASASPAKPMRAAEIVPGDTLAGEVAFEVPADSTSNIFHIETGWQNQSPVLVELAVQ